MTKTNIQKSDQLYPTTFISYKSKDKYDHLQS